MKLFSLLDSKGSPLRLSFYVICMPWMRGLVFWMGRDGEGMGKDEKSVEFWVGFGRVCNLVRALALACIERYDSNDDERCSLEVL